MTTALETRPRDGETWQEFQARKRQEAAEAQRRRREAELFRVALTGLKLDRYAFGVEHGLSEPSGHWRVHAYVVCKDCYRGRAGQMDPRTLVATSKIREELDPDNETLAVGVNMLEAVESMIRHERQYHRSR